MDAGLKLAYWPITAAALAAYLGGWAPGVHAAIALTALQTMHFALQARAAWTLAVQVRAAYLALLVAGLLPWLGPLHVAQLAGLAVRLVYDYCLMARLLALAPWNRSAPLSWGLVRWVICSPPAPGSILARMRARATGPAATDRTNGSAPRG